MLNRYQSVGAVTPLPVCELGGAGVPLYDCLCMGVVYDFLESPGDYGSNVYASVVRVLFREVDLRQGVDVRSLPRVRPGVC